MRPVLIGIAITSTGVWVVAALALLHRPRRRLAGRVRPYAAPALSALGRPVDTVPVATPAMMRTPVRRLAALLDGGGDNPHLHLRLRQAGLYDVAEELLVNEHRIRQLLSGLVGAGVGLALGLLLGLSGTAAVGVGVLVGGASALRPPAAVDRAIDRRRQRLRAEIPAMCQLLAVRLRASGSVVAALTQTLHRTHGMLATELTEALAQHRAGRPLDEALDAQAAVTPEPEAARVHRLLAGTIRHGLDAAPELLRLARDTREAHLMRLRREATGRRAAVLLPTIGLLAPLMLLFIAAPLPGLVLGS